MRAQMRLLRHIAPRAHKRGSDLQSREPLELHDTESSTDDPCCRVKKPTASKEAAARLERIEVTAASVVGGPSQSDFLFTPTLKTVLLLFRQRLRLDRRNLKAAFHN